MKIGDLVRIKGFPEKGLGVITAEIGGDDHQWSVHWFNGTLMCLPEWTLQVVNERPPLWVKELQLEATSCK